MGLIIFLAIAALSLGLYEYFDTKDWQLLTSADRNNVVFDQRNKKYGAYTLRRDYNDLMITVIVGMFVFVGVISAINFGINSGPPTVVKVPELDTIMMQLPSPPVEEEIKAPPSPIKIASGGGSGSPDNSRVDQTPDPMNRAHDPLSTEHTDHKEGQGNRDDRENPNNKPSTRVPSPFSGSGGGPRGTNGGIGTGPGKDIGNGPRDGKPGPGGGGGPQRKLEHGVDASSIKSDEACKVVLSLRVNPDGEVVNCQVVVSGENKTTTSNSEIIRQVKNLVLSQVRYSKRSGTGNDVIPLTIFVSAN